MRGSVVVLKVRYLLVSNFHAWRKGGDWRARLGDVLLAGQVINLPIFLQ